METVGTYKVAFGDWLKIERKKRNITQKEMCEQLNIAQSTLSNWENNKVAPPANMLDQLLYSLDLKRREMPDSIFFKKRNESKGDWIMERMSLYELPTHDSVKTFEGKTYKLNGFVGIETSSGEVEPVTDLYYRTKTVVSENKVIAKRKNEYQELKKMKNAKKVSK